MDVGGAERFTLNLCNYFSDRVKNITVYSSGGIFTEELKKINVRHIISGIAGSKNLPGLRAEIKGIICEGNFDIIHAQHRIYLPVLKSMNTGKAIIIYTANNFFNDFYQKLIFPDKAVAISPSIEKNLLNTLLINSGKISRINYGVEIKESFKPLRENISLGYMGRLIKEKGIYQLVNAVRGINSNRIRLIICGDGPERNGLLKIIGNGEKDCKIELLPPTLDIDHVYNLFDALVLPTALNEGLPISILEALARKILVISTAQGALSDVISDNVTGLLLEDNSEKSIINKISYLLENPPAINLMRENGYQKVKSEFSIDAMLDGYERLYVEG